MSIYSGSLVQEIQYTGLESGRRIESITSLTHVVLKDDKMLSPKRSQAVHNHSPDGWNWGYLGSGPSQLALGVMLEECWSEEEAIALAYDFKVDFIATLPLNKPWAFTSEEIWEWLVMKRQEAAFIAMTEQERS